MDTTTDSDFKNDFKDDSSCYQLSETSGSLNSTASTVFSVQKHALKPSATSIHDYDTLVANLKKENFQLKLRLYEMNEKMNAVQGIDSKLQVLDLQKENDKLNMLLHNASHALDILDKRHKDLKAEKKIWEKERKLWKMEKENWEVQKGKWKASKEVRRGEANQDSQNVLQIPQCSRQSCRTGIPWPKPLKRHRSVSPKLQHDQPSESKLLPKPLQRHRSNSPKPQHEQQHSSQSVPPGMFTPATRWRPEPKDLLPRKPAAMGARVKSPFADANRNRPSK